MISFLLLMIPMDPSRVPTKPVKTPTQIKIALAPTPVNPIPQKPKPIIIQTPSPVFLQAVSMIGQEPSYAVEEGWCWHFVEDALQQSHSGKSLFGVLNEAIHPQSGDIVFFFLPSKRSPDGLVGHVAIFEGWDKDWVYVINGNGASSSKIIMRDKYPRTAIDNIYKSR